MAVRPLHPPPAGRRPQEEYEINLSFLDSELPVELAADCERAREFTAIHAFLLGLRTGRSLPR